MGVTLKGFDKQYRKLKNAMPELNKKVPVVLGKYGTEMVKYARANHKFKTQTGQLERAISSKVDRKNWRMTFFIDEVRVFSNGYNYGWCQNDGTAAGYKRGAISPAVSPKGTGKGIQADDFMGRAWNQYVEKLTKELEETLIKALT